jgi:hypothetical protein
MQSEFRLQIDPLLGGMSDILRASLRMTSV